MMMRRGFKKNADLGFGEEISDGEIEVFIQKTWTEIKIRRRRRQLIVTRYSSLNNLVILC